MAPFAVAGELLASIPGVSKIVAEVVLAETGADMSVFPTAAHLASWAGTAPGSNESARYRSAGRNPVQDNLPLGHVPAHRRPSCSDESTCCRRELNTGSGVEHAHQR